MTENQTLFKGLKYKNAQIITSELNRGIYAKIEIILDQCVKPLLIPVSSLVIA
jgi:hypothetical protein